MTRIVGISGSLRRASFNTLLLRQAIKLAPSDVDLSIGTIQDFPLYNADIEREKGIPEPVAALKEQIAKAHGLLLVTPEYNNGVPGVLKNAIDWLSRPPKDIVRVFRDKPVGLIGATPGKSGTRFAQAAWLPTLRTLGTRPWFGRIIHLEHADQIFDANGDLIDEKAKESVTKFMLEFTAFIATTCPTHP